MLVVTGNQVVYVRARPVDVFANEFNGFEMICLPMSEFKRISYKAIVYLRCLTIF